MSELIGQSAAQQLAPGSVPLDRSSARLTAWWKERLPTTRGRGFCLDNHSGLSPRARVSPAQMVDMLRFAWNRRYGERRFLSLLPIAGWKGSLEEVLQVPTLSLRIWAKTGTMNYARALAGYLFTKRDRPMVFALFISDPAARRAYDGDDRRHMPASLATAETWLDRAKALEQALLERWILTN
jgi:D-alanyl-D-alanine carboxypeptidase/D-alanyl-D-alanine-endopeptidase (penicillin-binding protein 4)